MLSDNTRNLNIYYVNPNQHAEGHADRVSPEGKASLRSRHRRIRRPHSPTTLSNDQKNFYTAVQRLKLDVGQIVPVHGGPIAWRDFAGVAKRQVVGFAARPGQCWPRRTICSPAW
mgnify:CR=1 FL=1